MDDLYRKFDFLSNFLFEGLKDEQQEKIKELFEPIYFSKGDKLFYEEGVPTGVFYIEKGKVKKYKTVTGDTHQIFYVYTEGDLLGYHALLSNERYQDASEALEDVEAQFISKDNFLRILEEMPTLKMSIIKNLAHEFGVLANTFSFLAQKAQNPRLALFLLILNNRFNKSNSTNQGINIARQDLANIIGATRESLGRSLKEFKEHGFISVQHKTIFIDNESALYDLTGHQKHREYSYN